MNCRVEFVDGDSDHQVIPDDPAAHPTLTEKGEPPNIFRSVKSRRWPNVRRMRFAISSSYAMDSRRPLSGLRSRARGRHPFLNLVLGVDAHIRRHLVPLAAARKRILS
jgi:hypothetical protein